MRAVSIKYLRGFGPDGCRGGNTGLESSMKNQSPGDPSNPRNNGRSFSSHASSGERVSSAGVRPASDGRLHKSLRSR